MRRRASGVVCLLFTWAGCSPEFEMRKDPDLPHVSPKEARRLEPSWLEKHVTYANRTLDPAAWQIHTSLASREALTDNDPATVATSTDDHRIGEWILIDLGSDQSIRWVGQTHPPETGQPPRFRIDSAGRRGFPYQLQYVGSGTPGETLAMFARPVTARFVRVTIIEDSADPWLVSELTVGH